MRGLSRRVNTPLWSVVVLFVIAVMIAVVAYFAAVSHANSTARTQDETIAQLRTQLMASCAFAADIGGAPLPDSPKPGKLGVSIVVDSRAQWRALHCPGQLPVPRGLAKWAAYYHLDGS